MESRKIKSKILLHTCCAVCGVGLTKSILEKGLEPIIFFYNPNIHPKDEYEKRKDSTKKLTEIYKIEFIEGEYEVEKWFKETKGYEKEPEGGKRCPICFRMRLLKTAKLAKEKGIKYFATTLAASPYKAEKVIFGLGKEIAEKFGLKFLDLSDFGLEKNASWRRSRQLAREFNFYHQNYCGCIFSKRASRK
jgi:predicted adenine nucleotide alpha hydrolase (AANH) superfamily ATPase